MGTSVQDYKRVLQRKSWTRYRTILVLMMVGVGYFAFLGLSKEDELHMANRKLLADPDQEEDSGSTPLDDYPDTGFSVEQLEKGAVILHFLGMLYMFLALAIVCDEFFVPSLENITKSLKIKDDVAGATFMAAGGSAPELATSMIGVFTESSVGFGTIVGSAVFNVLFVIGMCSIFSKEVLTLTWWPLSRDVTFYSISLGCLAWVFSDEKIQIWEALILMGIYVSYVTFMAFNEEAYDWVTKQLVRMGIVKVKDAEEEKILNTSACGFTQTRSLWKVSIFSAMAHSEKQKAIIERQSGKSTFSSFGKALVMESRLNKVREEEMSVNRPKHSLADIVQIQNLKAKAAATAAATAEEKSPEGPSGRKLEHNISFQANVVDHALRPDTHPVHDHSFKEKEEKVEEDQKAIDEKNKNGEAPASETPDDDDSDEPLDLTFPAGILPRIFYVISFPLLFLLVFTIPDTRRPKYRKLYLLSFLLSIIWIGVFSYLMVWWATVVGYIAGIPDVVMGLTFLAAGTSVPDLLTSVIVARQGQGDMAVSSSIGSNLFDVCVGLPLPWFIYSVAKGKAVSVQSDSLLLSVLVLFAMLIAVIATIALSKWKMTKCMGATMFGLYMVFLLQALLVEFLDVNVKI